MPQGMNTGRNTPGLLDAGNRVVNRYLDELNDHVWLSPGGGVTDGSANCTEAIYAAPFSLMPAIKMTNTADSSYRWQIPLRATWRNNYARLTFWYGSSAAGTNTFGINWTTQALTPPSTNTIVGNANGGTYVGPTNAWDVLAAGPVTLATAPLTAQSHSLLKIQMSRVVADANNNDFYFLGGVLELYLA